MPDEALRLRHRTALELLAAGQLDGALALSLVIWPSPELEAWSKRCTQPGNVRWTAEHRRKALQLAADGLLSASEIAEHVCGSRRYTPTVKSWLRSRRAGP